MIYKFACLNFNAVGKRTEKLLPSHGFFVPCSSISACLDQDYDNAVNGSDRVFYLDAPWQVAEIPIGVSDCNDEEYSFDNSALPFEKGKLGEKICMLAKKEFDVFAPTKFHLVEFCGVKGSFEVYCNGYYCGGTDLGFGEFDVSEYVQRGKNLLTVRLAASEDGVTCGIIGDVLLKIKNEVSLVDYNFLTSSDGVSYEGALLMEISGNDADVDVVFSDGDGIMDEVKAKKDGDVFVAKTKGIFNTYTPETPYLYDAYIRVSKNGKEHECSHIKIAFSPIAAEGGKVTINGVPFKLKAVSYEEGEGKLKGDFNDELRIIKNFNFNTVIVDGVKSTDFYKLCSEMGLYVINVFHVRSIQEGKPEKKKKKNAEPTVNNENIAYIRSVVENYYGKVKAEPCILGYSVLTDDIGYVESDLGVFAENCGKPVLGVNIGMGDAFGAALKVMNAESIRLDEISSAAEDENGAGIIVKSYKDVGTNVGLFTAENIAKESAVFTKFAFRPYSSELKDNRTLAVKNGYAFKKTEGLTVKVTASKSGKESDVAVLHPVLNPGETQNYSIYIGEYDERTKLHVRYEENGVHIATETLRMKDETVRPEEINALKAQKYVYNVVNTEFGLDKLEENALKKRAYFVPFSAEDVSVKGKPYEAATTGDREFILSGEWDFLYFGESAPSSFGGDDQRWDKINLPSSWESAGFGKFAYSDGYPFCANLKRFTVGEDETVKNSVGVYRKIINVGDTTFRYVLSFMQVNGSIELQINGQYVGFSLLGTAEFDVTEYLSLGENEIVVIVKRWTPVSYLFGRGGFDASGIIGDVRLIKSRTHGLFDYKVSTKKMGADFLLDVDLEFFGGGNGKCKVELKNGEEVIYSSVHTENEGKVPVRIQGEFEVYSENEQNVYDLFVKVIEKNFVTECVRIPIAFNTISLVGDVLYYNDDPLKIRGIVYNPVYNSLGEILSVEDVRRDLELIKEYGFNAVRPVNRVLPEFVQIAASYGLYVIKGGEINTKAAGMNNEKTRNAVMNCADFAEAVAKVCETYAKRDNDAFNVIGYVFEEDGRTKCGEAGVKAIKEITTLPVACYGTGDVTLTDFPSINDVLDVINESAGRNAVFMAEYASGRGVGCATVNEYEELIKGTPCFLGGCVADFVDDVIKGVGKKADGIFKTDRLPYPSADSIRYLYRPLVSDLIKGSSTIEITNRTGITINDKYISLNILINGALISKTRLDINVPPYSTRKYDIFLGHIEEDMFLNVEYYRKKGNKFLYREQHILNEKMQSFNLKKGKSPVTVTEMVDYVDINFDNGYARINKRTASIVRYCLGKVDILKPDSIHRGGNSFITNINRPFVRNILNGKDIFIKNKSFLLERGEEPEIRTENILLINGKESYVLQDRYTFKANGVINVASVLRPLRKDLPTLDCFGKQLKLNNEFGNVTYYGNGATDNYIDMCEHTTIGLFNLNVDKTFEGYPTLQECGNRTNVRFAIVRNNDGEGIIISAKTAPYQLRVSPFSDDEIAESYLTGVRPKQSGVYVDVNAFVGGIGTSENGYPLPKYVVPAGEHVVVFDIIPVSALK